MGGEAIIYDESGGGGGVLLAAAAHVDLDSAHAHSATAAATTASAAAVVKPLVLSAEQILSVGGQESQLRFSLIIFLGEKIFLTDLLNVMQVGEIFSAFFLSFLCEVNAD